MKILISAFGSHGDILPFATIAKELELNGYEVIFYANGYFEYLFEKSKIKFVEIGTKDEYSTLFEADTINKPTKAFRRIAAETAELNRRFYYAMLQDISDKKDTVISSSMLFAGHLLQETHDINYVLIHLSPSIFRSIIAPAKLGEQWISKDTPSFIKNIAWWILDIFFYEPNFTKPLNVFRRELGLANKKYIFRDWIHRSDKLMALFPQWFASPQVDWVGNPILMDFLIIKNENKLAQNIEEFVGNGKPTVVFTAGTANGAAYNFFETSMKAIQNLNIQAIFVSHFNRHIPKNLPTNILHIDYAPYDVLLPKVAAFVHHGGIGSTAIALKSGTPQIICPLAYDQYDNSERAVNLGVAKEVLPKYYSVQNVTSVIYSTINDIKMIERCKEYPIKFQNNNTLRRICEYIIKDKGIRNVLVIGYFAFFIFNNISISAS